MHEQFIDALFGRLEDEQRRRQLTARIVIDILTSEYPGRQYIGKRLRPEIAPNDTPLTVARRYGVPRSTARGWITAWRK